MHEWVRAWRGMRSPLAGRRLVKTWPITDRAAAARSGARFLHRSCAELRDGNLREMPLRRSGRLAVNASAARCRRTVGSRKELRRALLKGGLVEIGIGTPWDPPKQEEASGFLAPLNHLNHPG